jgi:amino acid transporter
MAIVILANVITLVTAFSVSSLATSQRVGVGGAYFLISRSLGVEVGGAIGLPLYLSQSVSLTLYCYALAECIGMYWAGAPTQLLAAIFIVLVTAGALKATAWVLKSQIFIFVLVLISIASLFLGVDWSVPVSIPEGNYLHEDAHGFWQVFAVFFPAVTGILTGLSLSGDLKSPERSLPIGTLGAVLLGFSVYLIIPLALAHYPNAEELRMNPLVWTKAAAFPLLIFPGLLAAILSSAIGSILSAPRTLQALSDDGVLPAYVGKTTDGEPKFAMYLSGGVALLAVLLGDLNAVAIVVTMFFLTTYCMINVIAALGCFLVMILINPLASMLAFLIQIGIYLYISSRPLQTTWGDMRGGLMMAIARWALLAYKNLEEHRRNWRPHILVFSKDIKEELAMIQLASELSLGRGIVTIANLRSVGLDQKIDLKEDTKLMNNYLLEKGIDAFCEVDIVPSIPAGMVTVAQANGIAGLQSNTLMMGWPSAKEFPKTTAQVMHSFDHLQKSLIFTRLTGFNKNAMLEIDVWWSGTYDNGDLMLLLAHLLTQTKRWHKAKINLKTMVDDSSLVAERKVALRKIRKETRISAHCEVLERTGEKGINSVILENSKDAALVILGLSLPEEGAEIEYGERYTSLVEGLDNVILVRNSGPFRGTLIVED